MMCRVQLAAGFKALGEPRQALFFYAKAFRLDPENMVHPLHDANLIHETA